MNYSVWNSKQQSRDKFIVLAYSDFVESHLQTFQVSAKKASEKDSF